MPQSVSPSATETLLPGCYHRGPGVGNGIEGSRGTEQTRVPFTFARRTVAFVSARAPKEFAAHLASLGALVEFIPPATDVDPRFNDHPDLQMCSLLTTPGSEGKRPSPVHQTIVCSPQIHEWLETRLEYMGAALETRLVKGKSNPSSPYPGDCPYNCFQIDRWLICGKSGPDAVLAEEARRAGLELLRVPQGYARCSCIPAGNACITDDPSIAKALGARGVPVLRVPAGLARLEGFESGFIGGAAGVFANHFQSGAVIFSGPKTAFPAATTSEIEDFLNFYGFQSVWMPEDTPRNRENAGACLKNPDGGNARIADIGGVFFLRGDLIFP